MRTHCIGFRITKGHHYVIQFRQDQKVPACVAIRQWTKNTPLSEDESYFVMRAVSEVVREGAEPQGGGEGIAALGIGWLAVIGTTVFWSVFRMLT